MIDGYPLYPAAGYIIMAWRALAKFHGLLHTEMAVVVEHLTIHRATFLPEIGRLLLSCT